MLPPSQSSKFFLILFRWKNNENLVKRFESRVHKTLRANVPFKEHLKEPCTINWNIVPLVEKSLILSRPILSDFTSTEGALTLTSPAMICQSPIG